MTDLAQQEELAAGLYEDALRCLDRLKEAEGTFSEEGAYLMAAIASDRWQLADFRLYQMKRDAGLVERDPHKEEQMGKKIGWCMLQPAMPRERS